MKEFEIKTTRLPNLDTGDIWATGRHGVFVVVSSRPARWRGEDIDIYCHIDTWYTVRPATNHEIELWEKAVAASTQLNEQRKSLNAISGYNYSANDSALIPTQESRMVLNSYDDRWTPPENITLTPEQCEIEQKYLDAMASLKNNK